MSIIFSDKHVNSKLLGSVGGSRLYPITSAPNSFSQIASHDPLNPVCPVTKTLLF